MTHVPMTFWRDGTLVAHKSSLAARIAMRVPRRFLFIESARVGNDTTSWVRIHFRRPRMK